MILFCKEVAHWSLSSLRSGSTGNHTCPMDFSSYNGKNIFGDALFCPQATSRERSQSTGIEHFPPTPDMEHLKRNPHTKVLVLHFR